VAWLAGIIATLLLGVMVWALVEYEEAGIN